MTQKDEQLLLRDLSTRLPYGVKVHYLLEDNRHMVTKFHGSFFVMIEAGILSLDKLKPYLRPMSSMTEEECYEWNVMVDNCRDEFDSCFVDYCNRKHFDYRGLIEKGLALEAPEGMYKKGE